MALWKQIVIAIILGAAVGLFCPQAVPHISFLGDIFLLRTVGVQIVSFYLISTAFAAAIGLVPGLITQPETSRETWRERRSWPSPSVYWIRQYTENDGYWKHVENMRGICGGQVL